MQRIVKPGLFAFAIAIVTALVQTTPAHAQILQVRCSNDSLDPAQARARLEWARACGVRMNVKSPTSPQPPASAELTGLFDINNVPLWEYYETDDFWGRNSYSGFSADVNRTFSMYQWKPGPITAVTAALNFQKWTQPPDKLLARPYYPTFGDNADINSAFQLFPPPNYSAADCTLYVDKTGMVPANTTVSGFYVNGFCTASCYTPDQVIRFPTGDEPILSALTALRAEVTTLAPESTLQQIRLQTDGVASYTRELHDTTLVIFEIHTRSGGLLRITDKHPVLVSDGRIVEAQSLKIGAKLINADGALDPIVSIAKRDYFGKVYNLKPKSTNRVSNILIAQGFLVGSSRYQNEDVEYVNRIILGRGIPKEVIPQ